MLFQFFYVVRQNAFPWRHLIFFLLLIVHLFTSSLLITSLLITRVCSAGGNTYLHILIYLLGNFIFSALDTAYFEWKPKLYSRFTFFFCQQEWNRSLVGQLILLGIHQLWPTFWNAQDFPICLYREFITQLKNILQHRRH